MNSGNLKFVYKSIKVIKISKVRIKKKQLLLALNVK